MFYFSTQNERWLCSNKFTMSNVCEHFMKKWQIREIFNEINFHFMKGRSHEVDSTFISLMIVQQTAFYLQIVVQYALILKTTKILQNQF